MTRPQRRLHAWVWLLLGLLLAAGVLAALWVRPGPEWGGP